MWGKTVIAGEALVGDDGMARIVLQPAFEFRFGDLTFTGSTDADAEVIGVQWGNARLYGGEPLEGDTVQGVPIRVFDLEMGFTPEEGRRLIRALPKEEPELRERWRKRQEVWAQSRQRLGGAAKPYADHGDDYDEGGTEDLEPPGSTNDELAIAARALEAGETAVFEVRGRPGARICAALTGWKRVTIAAENSAHPD